MRLPSRNLVLGCVILLCGMPAHAYIDPGTGSALIQGVIAAVAAIGITARLYWHRIAEFMRRFRKKTDKSPDDRSKRTPP
jgi:hypothetical protein